MTNYSAERDTSIKGWFMRLFRFTLVPPHHVLVLLENGVFAKFLPTGYYLITKFRYTKGPFIPIGMRKPVIIDKITCRSLEGVPFKLKARVMFSFDPRDCSIESVKTQLVEVPDIVMGDILKRETDNAARVVAGRFREAELSRGVTLDELQKQITKKLSDSLLPLGFKLIGDVQLTEIEPDQGYEQMSLEALSMQRYARGLQDLSDEQRAEIYGLARMRHFGKGGGQMRQSRNVQDRPRNSRDQSSSKRRPDTFD